MKKKIVSIVSILTAIIMGTGIIACGDDDGIDNRSTDGEAIVLELKGLSSVFPSQQGSPQTAQMMEVICNTSWTISSTPLWINVDASGGNGNKSVRVWTTDENATGDQRSGIIIVKAGNIEKSIEVKQNPIGGGDNDVFIPISTRTLVVKLTGNATDIAAANVKYAGGNGSRSGNVVTFVNAASNGTVNVTGSGLINQSFAVDFGERSTIVVDVNIVKASTNIVALAAAEAGINVDNDTNNQTTTGVTGKLNLATNGSIADYSATGTKRDYSLVVYTPAAAPVSSVESGKTYNLTPYAVDCQPEGANFVPAAHIELTVPGVSEIGKNGILFRHAETNEDAQGTNVKEGDIVEGNLPHFSPWGIVVSAQCTGITESSEVIASGALVAGANEVTYGEKCGFEAGDDVKGILTVWLKLLYGATVTKVTKTTSINATGAGSYTISQKTFTATFKAGNKTFQAKYYGQVTAKRK